MPVDFANLVLKPAMATFAKNVTVYPFASQPATTNTDNPFGLPYQARGVFKTKPYDTALNGEIMFGDQVTSLGIRLSEFSVLPLKDDRIVIDGTTYIVQTDADTDGQGGGSVDLGLTDPPENLPEVAYT